MAHRIQRVNEEIRKELARILPQLKDPRIPSLVSITAVETTGDLKECKVYVSALIGDEKEMLKGLKSSGSFIRGALARNLKLRYTPELVFEIDHSIEHGAHINQIISSLDIREETDDDEE